jgi:hypothetical protein
MVARLNVQASSAFLICYFDLEIRIGTHSAKKKPLREEVIMFDNVSVSNVGWYLRHYNTQFVDWPL